MRVLHDRWNDVSHGIDRERSFRSQNIEDQLALVESKITSGRSQSQQRMQMMADRI
jgi:hypothetical protein